MKSLRVVCLGLALGACGCYVDLGGVGGGADAGPLDGGDGAQDLYGAGDLAGVDFAGVHDLAGANDLAGPHDLSGANDLAGPHDLSGALDLAAAHDLSSATDLAVSDLSKPIDLASASDLSTPPDLATAHDLAPPPDLAHAADLSTARPPCLNGPGFAAFRFHYGANGTSPILDAFGLPYGSNFEATPVFSTSIVDPGNGGGVEIGSGNWILIRYSVVGLSQIRSATFSIYGRSYDVSASGSFDAWSPLYGDDATPVDAVSNAWPYAWTSVDYTGHVQVGDDPGLTGIRLYSGPGSDDLVIHSVELCIDGS
jgi:hypothetical protein